MDERYVLQVYVGSLSRLYEALSIEASKTTTSDEIVECICEKLTLSDGAGFYELAEVMGNQGGQDCKERRIGHQECPVALMLLWPKKTLDNKNNPSDYKFCLRRKLMGNVLWSLSMNDSTDSQLIRDYFLRFLYQPRNSEYPDLCQLPDLTESTLMENLKARFEKGHIYTYVGSILIAVNPFTFYPIYNPKYVQLYQNRRLGDLPPHIFAIADAAYQSMLRKRTNQCIVISGESGSGKTESTNLLLHHLTALSQKGTHGCGVEQTILGAGPVLEAFGNAKTKFNNNSSRFGKFIQVNYKENGAVHGALVQKYLLEKSRIVSQVMNERNYHVFYYLLDGLPQDDKVKLHLTKPQDYFYLNQSKCYTLEGIDERHEFSRLTQSMELVGFSRRKQFLCFQLLSAVLHLGNVQFSKKSTYHSDETVMVQNPEVVTIISELLQVKEETLTAALTCKRTKAAKGEMLVINYKLPDAIATRDAMAKCLYGVLFDWIVMQVNHALLSKKESREHKGHSIGVLDIFGFEDFGDHNNFEQFCINYANERLQHYFNQHVFKYEQEEYQREGIAWRNIDFNDNTECLRLIEDRPDGLLYLLDDQCNFPCGSNETVLQKFIYHHNSNDLFDVPPSRQSAFTIKHYAGKVKYQIRDFREKNLDLMRPDIVSVLKVSQMAFVRELVCVDHLALFRWQILKSFFKAYFHFSKLRELSKLKRGLANANLIKEYSSSSLATLSSSPPTTSSSAISTTSQSSSTLTTQSTVSGGTKQRSNTANGTTSNGLISRALTGSSISSTIHAPHRALHHTTSGLPVLSSESSASSQPKERITASLSSDIATPSRITKALLSRQALFGGSSSNASASQSVGSVGNSGRACATSVLPHSSQCIHGALVRSTSSNFNCPVHGAQAHLCSSEARLMSRANKILMKKRYASPVAGSNRRPSFEKSIRNFKLLKSLLGPSGSGSYSSPYSASAAAATSHTGKYSNVISAPRAVRKQTQTVTHQFQQSLHQLMDTLSHANPFFVRCIKSNAEKMPNHFDDRLVLQQLRYTGMLETVRIRQSGYSVRLTFEEFIQHYRILLSNGLLSSKMDVQQFLVQMSLHEEMYQIGRTKVFMRESEKLILDERLHQEILRRIVNLQRWVRTWLCRKRFSEMRNAAIVIQTYTRRYIAQRRLSKLKKIAQYENWAATCIQKHWKSYQASKWFTTLRKSVVHFQSHCKGFLLRSRLSQVIQQNQREREESLAKAAASTSGPSSSSPSSSAAPVASAVAASTPTVPSVDRQSAVPSSTTVTSVSNTSSADQSIVPSSSTVQTAGTQSTVSFQSAASPIQQAPAASKKNSVSVSIRTMPPRDHSVDPVASQPTALYSSSKSSPSGAETHANYTTIPTPQTSSSTSTVPSSSTNDRSLNSEARSQITFIRSSNIGQESSAVQQHDPVLPQKVSSTTQKIDGHTVVSSSKSITFSESSGATGVSTIKIGRDSKLTVEDLDDEVDEPDEHDADQDARDFDDDDDFEHSEHSSRLNRRRNVAIRKTSFRSRKPKSLSEDKLPTGAVSTTSGNAGSDASTLTLNTSNGSLSSAANEHRALTKLSSDSNVLLSSGYNTCNSDSTTSLNHPNISRFYDRDIGNFTPLPLPTTSISTSVSHLPVSTSKSSSASFLPSSSTSGPYPQQQQQPTASYSRSSSITSTTSQQLPVSTATSVSQKQRLQNKFSAPNPVTGSSASALPESGSGNTGPIQKAKATLRNLINSKASQETAAKRALKQSTSVKYEPYAQGPGTNFAVQKSISNQDLGSDMHSTFIAPTFVSSQYEQAADNMTTNNATATVSVSSAKQSKIAELKSTQKDNFTLLSRHSVKKEDRFKQGEICAICENPMATFGQGQQQRQEHFKCTECKQLFHTKCIHHSTDIPCIKEGSVKNSYSHPSVLSALNPPRPPRSKNRRLSRFSSEDNSDSVPTPSSGCSLISHQILKSPDIPSSPTTSVRITQFTDPHDVLITDLEQLHAVDKLIIKKTREMDEQKRKNSKESMVDVVFKTALLEFRSNLISQQSTLLRDGYVRLTYKDLIYHFEQILMNVCQKQNTYTSFPVIMGVNAFRGYMDELRKASKTGDQKDKSDKQRDEKPSTGAGSKKTGKRKQSKKIRSRSKKEDEVYVTYEHELVLSMVNIYTVCEICSSFLWLMEKIYVCRRCKLTCHRKCAEKINATCRDNSKSPHKKVFGAPISKLISDQCRIPLVAEQLITKIELKGLYMEGIYRKSGTSSKINELKNLFDAQLVDIDLDQYSVHVLAATLKLFFREMPDPLMTYELYDDFLWATTISDPGERIQVILSHISKLPKANYDLLERLTFHLARVAQQESANRMTANSLAIVFAPCVLRTNKMMQMQDKLNDISKQTICIESIISERMRQISDTLNDIHILDVACHTASSRLSSLRSSKLNLNNNSLVRTTSNIDDDEEAILTQRINELKNEKDHLTNILPTFRLASACSDEDMLSANENDENVQPNNASSDECLASPMFASQPEQQASVSGPTSIQRNVQIRPKVIVHQKGPSIQGVTMFNEPDSINMKDPSPDRERHGQSLKRQKPIRFAPMKNDDDDTIHHDTKDNDSLNSDSNTVIV